MCVFGATGKYEQEKETEVSLSTENTCYIIESPAIHMNCPEMKH